MLVSQLIPDPPKAEQAQLAAAVQEAVFSQSADFNSASKQRWFTKQLRGLKAGDDKSAALAAVVKLCVPALSS